MMLPQSMDVMVCLLIFWHAWESTCVVGLIMEEWRRGIIIQSENGELPLSGVTEEVDTFFVLFMELSHRIQCIQGLPMRVLCIRRENRNGLYVVPRLTLHLPRDRVLSSRGPSIQCSHALLVFVQRYWGIPCDTRNCIPMLIPFLRYNNPIQVDDPFYD
jgi:hypothetical protein